MMQIMHFLFESTLAPPPHKSWMNLIAVALQNKIEDSFVIVCPKVGIKSHKCIVANIFSKFYDTILDF